MFRTITAKYAGICRRCNGPIAIGDQIRYGGAGRSYHLAKNCPASGAAPASDAPALAATGTDGGADVPALSFSYGSTVIHRTPAKRRSRGGGIGAGYGRAWQHGDDGSQDGAREFFQNPRGRCEDAPCCGCCS